MPKVRFVVNQPVTSFIKVYQKPYVGENGGIGVDSYNVHPLQVPSMLRIAADNIESKLSDEQRAKVQRSSSSDEWPVQNVNVWEELTSDSQVPGKQPARFVIAGAYPDGHPVMVRDWSTGDESIDGVFVKAHWAPEICNKVKDKILATDKIQGRVGISSLYGKYEGKRALIVGSSPSLERDIWLLKGAFKGKRPDDIVVIAINASARMLFREEIPIDYFFTLDWKGNPIWYKEWFMGNTNLVCGNFAEVPEEIKRQFKGTYYFENSFKEADDTRDVQFSLGVLDPGLTGTYSAIHLAYRMGCRDIGLLGQDFAYTDFMEHIAEPLTMQRATQLQACIVPDKHGQVTISTPLMMQSRDFINGVQYWSKNTGIVMTNCSSEGILDIPNIQEFKTNPELYEISGGKNYIPIDKWISWKN